MKLMGKHKTEEWQELDKTNPDSDYTEKEQMAYMEKEWRIALGQGWLFKWEND